MGQTGDADELFEIASNELRSVVGDDSMILTPASVMASRNSQCTMEREQPSSHRLPGFISRRSLLRIAKHWAQAIHPRVAMIAFNLASYASVAGGMEEAKARLWHTRFRFCLDRNDSFPMARPAILEGCLAHQLYHADAIAILTKTGVPEYTIFALNNASLEAQLLSLRKLNEFL